MKFQLTAFFIVQLLCLLQLKDAIAKDNMNKGRIVNGLQARIEDFPYQLSLRRNNQHICGAAVLDSTWAITAAHCVDGFEFLPQMFTLRIGTAKRLTGGQLLVVNKIVTHPNYDHDTVHCDVALLRTNFNRLRGDLVAPIKLPNYGDALPTKTKVIISGWGHTSSNSNILSNVLRYARVFVVDQKVCTKSLEDYGVITDAMFCAAANKTDACQGDSGGPIQSNGTLIGVVSWGVSCADSRFPGVYTRLAYPPIRQWIKLTAKI